MRGTSRTAGAMEICKGALAATTGQARSANMVDDLIDAPVAVGQVVPAGGATHAVTVAGQVVCTTGHWVSAGGHLVAEAGHLVSAGGQRVSATGHLVSNGGHCVSVGGHCVAT